MSNSLLINYIPKRAIDLGPTILDGIPSSMAFSECLTSLINQIVECLFTLYTGTSEPGSEIEIKREKTKLFNCIAVVPNIEHASILDSPEELRIVAFVSFIAEDVVG